jgi:hypothetical protein
MDTETETLEGRQDVDVERLGGDQPGEEAAQRAAGPDDGKDKGKAPADLSQEEEADATAWLLSSFEGDEDAPVQHLRLNVGSREEPKKIAWTVQAIPRESVNRIRQASEGNRQQRRSGAFGLDQDPESIYTGNLRIIVEGTVDPDVKAASASVGVPPPEFLRQAFGHKGGLVDYVAGEILALSGFDPDSVEDAEVAQAPRLSRAAGN